MSSVKKATFCAACIALCCVLPSAFHLLGAGAAFSPLHLPVLLCGLICGWFYGAFCGLAGGALCALLTGMPSAVQLVYILPELAVYGLAAGLLRRWIRTRSAAADLWLALIPAMLLGRIAGGLARAVFYGVSGEGYTIGLWISAYLVGTLPGMLVQLILIPLLVLLLLRTGLISNDAPKGERP